MALILDTNALSAAADREPGALRVVAEADSVEVPVVVLGEYRFAIAQSRHRKAYEKWLDEWTAAVSVLGVDQDTALHYAAVGFDLKRSGKLIPTNDLWIAALCRQHGLPVVSRDRHFDWVPGIQRLEW